MSRPFHTGETSPPCYLWIPIHILMWQFAFCGYFPKGFQHMLWNNLPQVHSSCQETTYQHSIKMWARIWLEGARDQIGVRSDSFSSSVAFIVSDCRMQMQMQLKAIHSLLLTFASRPMISSELLDRSTLMSIIDNMLSAMNWMQSHTSWSICRAQRYWVSADLWAQWSVLYF